MIVADGCLEVLALCDVMSVTAVVFSASIYQVLDNRHRHAERKTRLLTRAKLGISPLPCYFYLCSTHTFPPPPFFRVVFIIYVPSPPLPANAGFPDEHLDPGLSHADRGRRDDRSQLDERRDWDHAQRSGHVQVGWMFGRYAGTAYLLSCRSWDNGAESERRGCRLWGGWSRRFRWAVSTRLIDHLVLIPWQHRLSPWVVDASTGARRRPDKCVRTRQRGTTLRSERPPAGGGLSLSVPAWWRADADSLGRARATVKQHSPPLTGCFSPFPSQQWTMGSDALPRRISRASLSVGLSCVFLLSPKPSPKSPLLLRRAAGGSAWANVPVETYEDTAFYQTNGGFDPCGGHASPSGQYHYHNTAGCLQEQAGGVVGEHSPLIGWAYVSTSYRWCACACAYVVVRAGCVDCLRVPV